MIDRTHFFFQKKEGTKFEFLDLHADEEKKLEKKEKTWKKEKEKLEKLTKI